MKFKQRRGLPPDQLAESRKKKTDSSVTAKKLGLSDQETEAIEFVLQRLKPALDYLKDK